MFRQKERERGRRYKVILISPYLKSHHTNCQSLPQANANAKSHRHDVIEYVTNQSDSLSHLSTLSIKESATKGIRNFTAPKPGETNGKRGVVLALSSCYSGSCLSTTSLCARDFVENKYVTFGNMHLPVLNKFITLVLLLD